MRRPLRIAPVLLLLLVLGIGCGHAPPVPEFPVAPEREGVSESRSNPVEITDLGVDEKCASEAPNETGHLLSMSRDETTGDAKWGFTVLPPTAVEVLVDGEWVDLNECPSCTAPVLLDTHGVLLAERRD
jgi:hypothetical protein